MKRYWVEFHNEPPMSPMSFWVHRPVGRFQVWMDATEFDPPMPRRVPGRGYPCFFVEFNGFIFTFASLDELQACIGTLEQRLLPRTIDLSAERGTINGPNSHWLSRLPAKVKAWKYRQKAVAYLRVALAAFKRKSTMTG